MEKLINIKEAAEYLSVSAIYVYKLTSLKEIPYVRIGKRIMFKPSELEQWVDSHAVAQKG